MLTATAAVVDPFGLPSWHGGFHEFQPLAGTVPGDRSLQQPGTARVGGLVGHHRGTLTASYATGRVRGEREAGGLVGAMEPPGTVTAGYWDTDTSGLQSSAAGRGLTTAALQRGQFSMSPDSIAPS